MTSSTTTSPKKLSRAVSSASCTLFLSLSLPALAWGQTEEPEVYPEFLTEEGGQSQIPEVLTTTRLRQSKLKVPGTTTIIPGDMIRDLGIMNLVEVFRLVPGMVVGEYGSNNQVTSYHGTSQYEQRRLQVQIDGRTAYRPSLSDVDWISIPVALENIERIEVSRGPNAAAHGINAFLGSINIITRSPYDTAGAEAYTSVGSRGYLRTFTSVGDSTEDGSWRLSYEKRKSDGFDRQKNDEKEEFHDGFDINNFNFDSLLAIDSYRSIDFRAGVVDGINEEDRHKSERLGGTTNPDIIIDQYYLQTQFNGATSNSHFYHLAATFQNMRRRQPWSASIPAEEFVQLLPPGSPFPTDQGPFIADFNEDAEESRLEFELQDTLIVNPEFKLVSGLGYRKDTFDSETYFNGRGNNYQTRLFANAEYSPSNWVTFNLGGNWEKTTTTNESYFSPRVATNFIINDNHALRFVFSRAVRTPDAFEQSPDWSYRPRNVQPPFAALEGERFEVKDLVNQDASTFGEELEEERITSREISYFGQYHFDHSLMSVEVRYFNDYLRDVISGIMSEEYWFIDNNVAIDQEGVELEGSLEFPGTLLRATYAFLDQDTRYSGDPDALPPNLQSRSVVLMERLSARQSGSLAWIQELPWSLTSSTAFYLTHEVRKTRFKRIDFRLARRMDHPKFSYVLAFTVQHYINQEAWMSPDNIIDEPNQYFVEAGIRF